MLLLGTLQVPLVGCRHSRCYRCLYCCVLLPSILNPPPLPGYKIFAFVPSEVEPPHGSDPGELEIPALREMKSSAAGPTVWSEFSALAAETGAPVNLGQVCGSLFFVFAESLKIVLQVNLRIRSFSKHQGGVDCG